MNLRTGFDSSLNAWNDRRNLAVPGFIHLHVQAPLHLLFLPWVSLGVFQGRGQAGMETDWMLAASTHSPGVRERPPAEEELLAR